MQKEDKDGIQDHIGYGSGQYGLHAHLCESLTVDIGIHSKRDHDEDGAEQIDDHIAGGIGVGGAACAEQMKQRPVKCNSGYGQNNSYDNQHETGIIHDLSCCFFIIFSSGDRAQRRASSPEEVGEGCYHGNHRKAQAKPCQGQSSFAGESANVDPVNDVVEQVQKLCRQHGRSQRQDTAGYIFLLRLHLKITSFYRYKTFY